MTVHLSAEQEQRIASVIRSGAYGTVEDIVEAALIALEQRTMANFEGTETELETLLHAGFDSPEIPADAFWHEVDGRTDAWLAEAGVPVRK